jgi:hypothetical protein
MNHQHGSNQGGQSNLKDNAQNAVEDVRAKAAQAVDVAEEKVAKVGEKVNDNLDSAMTSVGGQMNTLAQTVREKAPEGKVGDVAYTAADALERGGRYLQDADTSMVRSDLENIIRRYPMESLLVGLGVGYLLARSMRRM